MILSQFRLEKYWNLNRPFILLLVDMRIFNTMVIKMKNGKSQVEVNALASTRNREELPESAQVKLMYLSEVTQLLSVC